MVLQWCSLRVSLEICPCVVWSFGSQAWGQPPITICSRWQWPICLFSCWVSLHLAIHRGRMSSQMILYALYVLYWGRLQCPDKRFWPRLWQGFYFLGNNPPKSGLTELYMYILREKTCVLLFCVFLVIKLKWLPKI